MHPQVLAKIVQIRDSNGRPIFQTALEAPAGNSIGSILGYPVVLAAAMPSTDSAGNVVAVFGDPQGGAVGIRKQFELAQSDHFEFTSNNSVFRALIRAGFIIKSATSFAKLTLAAQ
jgi:HK97 family phage major capsid protein